MKEHSIAYSASRSGCSMETVSLPVPPVCEEYTNVLHFYLNGKPVTIQHPDPELTLLQYVRGTVRMRRLLYSHLALSPSPLRWNVNWGYHADAGFTGTKLGCGEGGCGACTIMVSRWDGTAEKVQHLSVNGCLLPLCAVDGAAVTTVEGLGSTRRSLSDVQVRRACTCYWREAEKGVETEVCGDMRSRSTQWLLLLRAAVSQHRSLAWPLPTDRSVAFALQALWWRCTPF